MSRYGVLTAMIFAVAMMSIDQTIVSIAAPTIQRDLSLTSTGLQWVINGYLLALAALFALGGKISDVVGHRRMVLAGTVGFAAASALCGATPSGGAAQAWLIVARLLQGAFGALLFPAALAIVFNAFAARERGKALALFFGISGALTSVGPIAGSFLLPWTWRAIFLINVPVALVALWLTWRADPADTRRPVPIDWRGAALVSAGMGLSVLGLQQAGNWGWSSAATWACLAGGLAVLAGFARFELRQANPLIDVRIFRLRGFAADNVVMGLVYGCFLPLFFFASVYAQVVLGYDAGKTGLYILVIFIGFAAATQLGGRILDRRGARPAAVVGSALGAAGFYLWAGRLHQPLGSQWPWIVMAGAGIGFVLTPVTTDAVNRAPRGSYGEVTGVTQTVRYFTASLSLAVLGSVLIHRARADATASLARLHLPKSVAAKIVASLNTGAGTASPHRRGTSVVFAAIQSDFAQATRVVYLAMAGIMAASFLVAVRGMERGIPIEVDETVDAAPAAEPGL
ncbi:MAG TPA: MFS transporter [Gaiellaceae bacterium]|nr:MFS transporter [Gaiellaceae bacterium]